MRVPASRMNREKKIPTKGSWSFLKLTQCGIPLAELCFIAEVVPRGVTAHFSSYDACLNFRRQAILELKGRYGKEHIRNSTQA